ncbi:hypothetical protein NPIL_416011 [Nephila pilipes]|uniref:Uncharacterized protein n=1 Tax=Nephila pilipes TaxID=299642 RepID=A0A8X6QCQ5_NEPPI|nr:hypothetical protein NPIL_416011 [Nephila pilipes]
MTSTEESESTLQFLSYLKKQGKHPLLVWVMKLGLNSCYACPKCGDDLEDFKKSILKDKEILEGEIMHLRNDAKELQEKKYQTEVIYILKY